MKKILIGLFVFIIAVKLLDFLLFKTLDFFYEKTFVGQDGGDINKYLHDKNPPQLVILGSSTTRFQVNPDSFSLKTCNLARAQATDCYQLGLLSLMIQYHKSPVNILLSVWPRNYLVSDNEKQSEDILFLRYYYNQSQFIRKEIDNVSYSEPVKFLFYSYRFNGLVPNILRYYYLSRRANTDKYYFKYQNSSANDSINTSNAVKLRNTNMAKLPAPLSANKAAYLLQFIDTCKKYNINLYIYYMPQLNEDTILIKKAVDFIETTCSKNAIPYFKFNEQNAAKIFSNLSYWSDGEHLNEKGGALQSQILARFVK